MTGGKQSTGCPPEQDRREKLLEEYFDRLNAGERIDPEDIRREHPAEAEGLIEDLQAFASLDASGLTGALVEEHPLGTLGDCVLRRQIGRGGMGGSRQSARAARAGGLRLAAGAGLRQDGWRPWLVSNPARTSGVA